MRRIGSVTFGWLVLYSGMVLAAPNLSNSNSFRIYTYSGGPGEEEILQRCQSIREQIHNIWFIDSDCQEWEPPCEIVLHGTRARYVQAIGSNGIRSYGSSLIRSDGHKICQRRIDLLANQAGEFTALTHELTHVILADRFQTGRPPLWADEGIATLADSENKQSLHRKDCLEVLRTGRSLRIIDLLHMNQFTSPHQVPAFYGQSLVLVQFLTRRDTPSKLILFLESAKSQGYDRALRDFYEIDGVVHLEGLWHEFALTANARQASASPCQATGD